MRVLVFLSLHPSVRVGDRGGVRDSAGNLLSIFSSRSLIPLSSVVPSDSDIKVTSAEDLIASSSAHFDLEFSRANLVAVPA